MQSKVVNGMFNETLKRDAQVVLDQLRAKKMTLASAESCTGGSILGLLTEIAGSSDVVDRGYITYSNRAKSEDLNISMELIDTMGAVSSDVGEAMARGALQKATADVSIAVTGIAGPGGGTSAKPVGLVYIAAARKNNSTADTTLIEEHRFGDIGRTQVREQTIKAALALILKITE